MTPHSPNPPLDANRRLKIALINQLGFPGVGTVMVGRKSGYFQAAIMVIGLSISLIYFYRLAQDLIPVIIQMNPASSPQEAIQTIYQQHKELGQLGLGISLLAWFWSLISSIAILNPPQN